MRIRILFLASFFSGCFSAPPNVLVTVADDDHVADSATEIAYAFSADGDQTAIALDGRSFPVTFVLQADEDQTRTVWVFANDAEGEPAARATAKAVFRKGSSGTARVVLTGVCAYGHPEAVRCTRDSGSLGVCRAGRCTPGPACGNGRIDEGEQCDDGEAINSDTLPDRCRKNCLLPFCGDDVIDANEECDNGTANADTAACRPGCVAQVCGDGFVGPTEECDAGAMDTVNCDFADGDPTHGCTRAECGDAYVNAAAGEECDDGEIDTEICDFAGGTGVHACTWAECGDQYTNTAAGEECDGGALDTEHCDYGSGASGIACTRAVCGDGYENAAAFEECDAGPTDTESCDYAGASPLHRCSFALCGDSYTNMAAGEACDGGVGDTAECDYASGDSQHACTPAECGDGHVNVVAGERCDDGDHDISDLCPDGPGGTCREAVCGDGIVGTTLAGAEECDGGTADTLECNYARGSPPAACTVARCGDGYTNMLSEGCDDQNDDWTDGCHPICLQSFRPPRPLNLNALGYTGHDQRPRVTSDGKGLWVAVWGSNKNIGGVGSDKDILMARSMDQGTTWTFPAPVDADAYDDVGSDTDPALATDGAGTWVVVWKSDGIAVARSVDDGLTWTPPFRVSAVSRSGEPDVATDRDGDWVVVWEEGDLPVGDSEIRFARSDDNAETWRAAATLNTDAAADGGVDDRRPQVATDGAGHWVVVWAAETPFTPYSFEVEIRLARSTNGGEDWTAPDVLYPHGPFEPEGGTHPQIATDGSGTWLVVWSSRDSPDGQIGWDTDLLVARSMDNGVGWSPVTALNSTASTDSGRDEEPQIASDGAGSWVVVWRSDEDVGGSDADSDILVASSADGGISWTEAAPLHSNATADSGTDRQPAVASDGAGTWVSLWASDEDLAGTGTSTDTDILTVRSTSAGWSSPALLNQHDGVADTGDDIRAAVAINSGVWLAVWSSNEDLGGIGTDSDVLMTRSVNNGLVWSFPAPLSPNAGDDSGDDGAPEIAVDSEGYWVVVWRSREDLNGAGTDWDVFVSRSADAGETWTAPALLNSNGRDDSGIDWDARIAVDDAGHWLAVWASNDAGSGIGSDWDILVARSSDHGATWTPAVPLHANASSDSGNDQHPDIAVDKHGNWVAVWQSDEDLDGTDTDDDLFVARSTDHGATWTPPTALNDTARSDYEPPSEAHDWQRGYWDVLPRVATDREGTWVAIWLKKFVTDGAVGMTMVAARSTDEGRTWGSPVTVHRGETEFSLGGYHADLVYERHAGWVATWESDEDWTIAGKSLGADYDVLIARSTDGAATWTEVAPLNYGADTDAGSMQGAHDSRPRLATDGAGNWVAVWYSEDDLGGTAGSDADILFTAFTIP